MEPHEEFKIKVSSQGTEPLFYQWYKDGKKISDKEFYEGFESAELTIKTAISLSGSYHCTVKDQYCQIENSEIFKYGECMKTIIQQFWNAHMCIPKLLLLY